MEIIRRPLQESRSSRTQGWTAKKIKNKKINKSIEKEKDTLIEITQIKSLGQSVPHLAKSF